MGKAQVSKDICISEGYRDSYNPKPPDNSQTCPNVKVKINTLPYKTGTLKLRCNNNQILLNLKLIKKKGRKVLSQSILSIKKLELEVNKLNESLDSIDSKYDTIFDSLVLTFRDFEDNYSISNNLNLDQRILEIELFIEEYKIEKEIHKKAEENENQSNLTIFFHYLSSSLVVILVSFLITFFVFYISFQTCKLFFEF